jgi:ATPase family associated with various cellular activities (AAA)
VKIYEMKVPEFLSSENPTELFLGMLRKAYVKRPVDTSTRCIDRSNSCATTRDSISPGSSSRFVWTPVSSPSPSVSSTPTAETQASAVPSSSRTPRKESSAKTRNSRTKPALVIIVIDEIDALGRSDNSTDLQASIKAALFHWLDYSADCDDIDLYHPVCIVATSNRPSDVDERFRRGGRIEYEVDVLGTSNVDKLRILKTLLSSTGVLAQASDFLEVSRHSFYSVISR